MAGGQERILRGRIKAMQSTKKITRAMELIAGSRIVKAQQRVQAAVPYSEQITEIVRDLAAVSGGDLANVPLLEGRETIERTCYVVMTADRGLCGGYNAGVQRAAEGEIKADVANGLDYTIIPVGKKALSYFRFRGYQLGEAFNGFSEQPSYEDARAIGRHVVELFTSGEVDKVELVYTRFITAGSQEVVLRPLVPLGRDSAEGGDGKDEVGADFEFEPDPLTILDTLLPRYVEARIFAALLNAAASEHAFRQRAMKSATDNAEELIRNLSIVMNRARQASITQEIMEIVGGATALEGDDHDEAYIEYGDDGDVLGSTPIEPVTVAHTATMVDDEPNEGEPGAQAGAAPSSVATLEREGDDLTRIVGVSPELAERLTAAGTTTYRQLATLTGDDVDRLDERLEAQGAVRRDDWPAQARALHAETHPNDPI